VNSRVVHVQSRTECLDTSVRRVRISTRCNHPVESQWGKEILKEREENQRREVWDREGWVWDLEGIDSPSIFRFILSVVALVRMLPTLDWSWDYWERRATEVEPHWSWFVCSKWTPEVSSYYNERLNAKTEGSKRLAYTGLRGYE
jgi:hypothetical protein